MRILVAILLASLTSEIVASEVGCTTSDSDSRPELEQALNPYLLDLAKQGFVGGVAIMHGDRFIYERVVGIPESSEEPPLFHVASVTKYFTAALVMKLAELGLISLGDPLEHLLPDVPADKAGGTVKELLTHRSGLGSSYVGEKATK